MIFKIKKLKKSRILKTHGSKRIQRKCHFFPFPPFNFSIDEQFNRQLNQLLTAFERNKEWADIGNWLQKIENLLIEYKDPIIKEKITLGKRLSQCLNPILPPGTHLQALKVYELLFSNMALDKYQDVCKNPDFVFRYSEDLGIYSSGLFPFFQYASSQVFL